MLCHSSREYIFQRKIAPPPTNQRILNQSILNNRYVFLELVENNNHDKN